MPEQRSKAASDSVTWRDLDALREQTDLKLAVVDERLSSIKTTAYVTKTEMDSALRVIDSDVRRCLAHMSEAKGVASVTAVYGSVVLALLALALSVVAMFR